MDKKGKKVVIDTNIFIIGFLDFVSGTKSTDADIIRAMLKREFILVLSKELEEQIARVGKRVKDKDWTGYIRSAIWSSAKISFVMIPEDAGLMERYKEVPRKDLLIFLTALFGNADYLVSNNREFIRKTVNTSEFQCLTTDEFVKMMIEKESSASAKR
jgi:predicted nucleic acid-binding protein